MKAIVSSDVGRDTIKATRPPSGRFILRLGPLLHATLREESAGAGLSLNEYCARRLAMPANGMSTEAAAVIEQAARVAGKSLVGVVVFGSWARGNPATGSDVDVLVVLGREQSISRDLYRRWDRQPLQWDGHPVEPHFVHLPKPKGGVSSVWAEVAVGGIVLHERDYAISRELIAIREAIAAGKIVRRLIHGQPYWVEAA